MFHVNRRDEESAECSDPCIHRGALRGVLMQAEAACEVEGTSGGAEGSTYGGETLGVVVMAGLDDRQLDTWSERTAKRQGST
ncbi:hypothetical protein Kisp02_02380 [Kineosporia sp. NBRC 101731]|nr:hypothetical protein Kisp02_02380 [Kineosporia sp. NBRC 101731]